jgi:hypothetical protein
VEQPKLHGRADWVADMLCHHPLRPRSCQH